MRDSNFLFYTVIALVIGHIIFGFVYLMIKLSPKKKDKNDEEEKI